MTPERMGRLILTARRARVRADFIRTAWLVARAHGDALAARGGRYAWAIAERAAREAEAEAERAMVLGLAALGPMGAAEAAAVAGILAELIRDDLRGEGLQ